MEISPQKLAANQRNARLSTGPKTPEGKTCSARNATTHGLSSGFAVLAHEDQAAFNRLLETYCTEFAPKTEHERFLVEQMAQSRWRLDRIRRFEACAFDEILFDEADETNPEAKIVSQLTSRTANIFDLLQRYAAAAERSYYRAHRELTSGRAAEKQNEANTARAWLERELHVPSVTSDDPTIAPPGSWWYPEPRTSAHPECHNGEIDPLPPGR